MCLAILQHLQEDLGEGTTPWSKSPYLSPVHLQTAGTTRLGKYCTLHLHLHQIHYISNTSTLFMYSTLYKFVQGHLFSLEHFIIDWR